MKKLILGIGLMLNGVIGAMGWCITAALLVEPGAKSNIWACLDGEEWSVFLIFMVMALVGLLIAIQSLREDRKKDEH